MKIEALDEGYLLTMEQYLKMEDEDVDDDEDEDGEDGDDDDWEEE